MTTEYERMQKAEETLEEIYSLMFPDSDNYIIPRRKISTKLNRDICPHVVLCPTCDSGWLGGARFTAIEKMIRGYNNWWKENAPLSDD